MTLIYLLIKENGQGSACAVQTAFKRASGQLKARGPIFH
jgi:hypothetical protein